jgi:predicted ATPase
MVFLPSVSGLTPVENLIQKGAINRLVGEGRTAEVLRNICFNVYEAGNHWQKLIELMKRTFGVEMLIPQYRAGSGDITMKYRERTGIELDISAAGRGMLQILFLLAYMYDNPNSILLLDEPDTHLEILRQQEIYQLLVQVAKELNSQVIPATHSEVIMNAAGDKDVLIACVGKPHRIDNNDTRYKSKSTGCKSPF